MHQQNIDFSSLILPVAVELKGQPSSQGKKPRWGKNGSFTLDTEKGTWYSHEEGAGGGVLALIQHFTDASNNKEALQWLEKRGFISAFNPSQATPEQKEKAKERAEERFNKDAAFYQLLLRRTEIEEEKGDLSKAKELAEYKKGIIQTIDNLRLKHGLSPSKKTNAKKQERQEAINACYEFNVLSKPSLNDAAEKAGLKPLQVAQFFNNHLKWKYSPLHAGLKPTHKFNTFEKAFEQLRKGKSAFIQAPQGTGKTRSLARPLIEEARLAGRPVVALTVLRSLAEQNGEALKLDVYNDAPEIIEQSDGVSSTIHSFSRDRMMPLIMRLINFDGLVVIDEAAAVAGLLADPSSILSGEEKARIYHFLQGLNFQGIQVICLDADLTPEASELAELLGLNSEVWQVTEQPYALPSAVLYPAQRVESGSTAPLLTEIKEKLLHGKEQVVLFSSTRKQAETLYQSLKGLCQGKTLLLTGKNNQQQEQADFLLDPDAKAPDYQLIIYSPVLSAGFSVVSVEPCLYGFLTHDNLDAPAFWQLARRFRRPANNQVKISIPLQLQKTTRAYNPDIQLDIKEGAGQSYGFFEQAMIASLRQKNLNSSNPFYAFAGHLLNAGIQVQVNYDSSEESQLAASELAEAKEEIEQQEIEAVATAEVPSIHELMQLERSGAGTPEAWAKLERQKIADTLMLNYGDRLDDGTLPRELVADFLHERLGSRVERRSLLDLAPHELAFITINQDMDKRFAFRSHHSAQIELVRKIFNEVGDSYTGAKAREIADRYRTDIKSYWKLVPKPPRKGIKNNSVFSQWLKNLLHSFGFNAVSKRNDSLRFYSVISDDAVTTYSSRNTERLKSEIHSNKGAKSTQTEAVENLTKNGCKPQGLRA